MISLCIMNGVVVVCRCVLSLMGFVMLILWMCGSCVKMLGLVLVMIYLVVFLCD